jgi:type I restriction enzyme S subunit
VLMPVDLADQVLHFSIPALESTGRPVVDRSDDIASAKSRLRGGEILVSRLNPRKGRVVLVPKVLPMPSVASTEFVVLRPIGSRVDSRYLAYMLGSETFRQNLDSQVRSVTRSHQRVEPEAISQARVHLPSLEDQRRIADFLGDQVAHIDNIIAARQAQLTLLRDWESARLDDLCCRADVPTRPLQAFTDSARPIQYGIVLPGPHFPGGVPIIKGGDVAAHRLKLDLVSRTDPEIEARYPRSRMRAGDLVMAIRGGVGELGVVPDELDGANLTQDTARIAPLGVDAAWLRWVLASRTIQSSILQRVTGATITGINIGELRRLPVPVVDAAEQAAVALAANRLMETSRMHREQVDRAVALLRERKRSLIAAAVTGDLDVTTASSRGIGVSA